MPKVVAVIPPAPAPSATPNWTMSTKMPVTVSGARGVPLVVEDGRGKAWAP